MVAGKFWLSVFLLTALHDSAPGAETRRPVYIHLFSRIDDHLNLEIGDEKLRRTVAMLEHQRKTHPGSGPSCVYQFTGAVSHMFSELNSANRVVDFIKGAVSREAIEVGYDGEAEPIDLTRPQPNFRRAATPEARWLARSEALEWFLTEFKEFITGEPDPQRSGGLKRTQEVFGAAVSISRVTSDLGGDPELTHLLRQWNRTAILAGFPEPHTYPARNIHGYGGSVSGFSRLMSPAADCAPEVFWQDNYLRLSDTSGPAVRPFAAVDGLERFEEMLDKIDRSRPHVIRVQLGHDSLHLKAEFLKANPSPVRYAYEHPKSARLPADALRPREEVEEGYRREEALIRWLAEDYFPANPGSRFVSAADLKRMAANPSGSNVPLGLLKEAAQDLLRGWKGTAPASMAQAQGAYFSLAEMFQMLANALGESHRTGSFPSSLHLTQIYGPLHLTGEAGPNQGALTVRAIARAAADLTQNLNDQSWKPVPNNVVPSWVTVEEVRLTSAQFLRLMAEALTAASAEAKLAVQMCNVYSEAASMFPYMPRRYSELGATWTVKPAPFSR